MARNRTLMHLGVAALLAAAGLVDAAQVARPIPAQMRAMRTDPDAAPGTLKLLTVDVPKPGEGQVLLEVHAASANPSDWRVRGAGPAPGAGAAARMPGGDAAGVVVAVGPGVTAFKVGDKVLASLGESGGGAYADYALANIDNVALKPASFTYEQAAGIPIAGFAGMRMVVLTNVKKGDRVLVIGAAGGVGSTAVQGSKARGAAVISSASSRHEAYLKKIGVDEIISYDKEDVAAKAKNIDVVINAVDSQNAAAVTYAKRGGRVVVIGGVPDATACAAAGVTCMGGGGRDGASNGDLIRELVRLANAGQFTVLVDKVFPLEEANAALTLGRNGNREGKIVLAVRADSATR